MGVGISILNLYSELKLNLINRYYYGTIYTYERMDSRNISASATNNKNTVGSKTS
jgi:hypothetical protein